MIEITNIWFVDILKLLHSFTKVEYNPFHKSYYKKFTNVTMKLIKSKG